MEIQLNHTYLLRYKFLDSLSSVTILNITDKAYNLRWNRGLESYDTWETKEHIHDNYKVIEDISDFVQNNTISNQTTTDYNVSPHNVKIKWIQCPNCGGSGSVPDNQSTAGCILCPVCSGTGTIAEAIEIS